MDKSSQHLGFLIQQTSEVMHEYNGAQLDHIAHTYLELISRLHAGCKGLQKLVANVSQEPELEFCIGLIIRTFLLDFMIGLRGKDIQQQLQSEGKNKEEIDSAVKDYMYKILADGLRQTGSLFIRFENRGLISEAQLHSILENLSNRYSFFLKGYKHDKQMPVVKFPGAPQVSTLFEELSESPEVKLLSRKYETYALYSKYEHFGAMSAEVFRRDQESQFKTIKEGIEILLLHFFICLSVLKSFISDNFFNEKYLLLVHYTSQEVFGMTDEEVIAHFNGQ